MTEWDSGYPATDSGSMHGDSSVNDRCLFGTDGEAAVMRDGTVNNAHLFRCGQCARCSLVVVVVADDGDVAGIVAIFFAWDWNNGRQRPAAGNIIYGLVGGPKMLSRGETVELSLGCSRGQRLELNGEY